MERKPIDIEHEILVDTRVAAEHLTMAPATLEIWRHKGVGPDYYKINGSVRYSLSHLNQYLAESIVTPESA